ncbi:hypothetical protein A6F68_00727 [Tsuneonella dongtanensis]|uniref:Lysozyme inhibitor LprI N-terminal domain-containing protein n=1 Tax=Tsuneonella dongtanensis TaxID=692370 RepID=A0A1B2AAT8_9SPHN|nr:hypothetical protein [Tsuneonella dongtanensis]ANY19256.1 hypothetical protein A6F68_00727 [Tsuneonella dongtanensis]
MFKWIVAAMLVAFSLPSSASAQEGIYQPPVPPPCRRVGDVPGLTIDPQIAANLAEIGLDRAGVFERMQETSIPETMGCWAMPVGNFDSQLVSVGMAQWNYGTGSLQPVLKEWRASFGSKRKAKRELARLAPTYGKLLFSKGCLAVPVSDECRAGILAAHGPDGKLNPVILSELTALFESDAMLQVQLDHYLALLGDVRGELQRVFPYGPITPRKVRWAIDTRVQQNRLPPSEDIARLRQKLVAMPPEERWQRLDAIFDWYEALSKTIDQDGIGRDYAWNVVQWRCLMEIGRIDDEQYELLHITFLRSRSATGNSGRWQALTFSRRGKIILGVGSVSGVRDGSCTGS